MRNLLTTCCLQSQKNINLTKFCDVMRTKKNTTVNELICEKIAMLQMQGKYPTARNYRALLHFIENNYGLLKASECDSRCVLGMKVLMKDLSTSTQSSYFACLKSIWNYAAYKGYTGKTEYPFQRHQYEIDKVKVPKMKKRTEHFLTVEQISRIYHHWTEMPDQKERDRTSKRYVALFLFSYLGNGANISDLARMRYTSDWFNSDGKILSFIRHKTADKSPVKVQIPVTKWLKPIVEYIADEPQRNGLVLSSFLGGIDPNDEEKLTLRIMYLNAYTSNRVRKVCKAIGLRDDVSVTFARHTYSTTLHHIGAPFALVERNLGHSGSDIAFNYIGGFSTEDLFKWNELLIA